MSRRTDAPLPRKVRPSKFRPVVETWAAHGLGWTSFVGDDVVPTGRARVET